MPRSLLIGGTIVAVIAFGPSANATPQTSGLFLSATDYQNGVLSSQGDCTSDTHKLEIHDLLNKPYIDVTHDGQHRRYAKSELYGYRSCSGIDYRFAGKHEYRIAEARTLYIYIVEQPARLGKDTARDYNKLATYYFSVSASGDMLPLTVLNLKRAFPENHKFHDSVDGLYASGSLEQYDDFHKMFRVNHMLEMSEGR